MKHHHAATDTAKPVPPKKAKSTAVKGEGPVVAQPPASGDGRDEIVRQTAYFFYEARGRMHGHELEDWLRAESEVERSLAENREVLDAGSSAH